MLSADELAQMQADVAAAVCDKPCVIRRPVTTPDAWGTASEPSYTVISDPDLMCGTSQPSAGQLSNYAYVIGSLAAWQVRFPIGTVVQAQDLIDVEGQTLTTQVLLGLHSYPALLTVLATEVK